MNNQKRFPTSLLKDGDPNNYLTRAIRKLEKENRAAAKLRDLIVRLTLDRQDA